MQKQRVPARQNEGEAPCDLPVPAQAGRFEMPLRSLLLIAQHGGQPQAVVLADVIGCHAQRKNMLILYGTHRFLLIGRGKPDAGSTGIGRSGIAPSVFTVRPAVWPAI